MRDRTSPWIRLSTVISAIGLAILVVASASAEPPPVNRTYFTLILGQIDVDIPGIELGADCLTFSETEVCASEGDFCGIWFPTETGGKQTAFAFDFDVELDGVPTQLDGQMRVDSRGTRNSIGGAARLRISGQRTTNLGLVGRPMSLARCDAALAELEALIGG